MHPSAHLEALAQPRTPLGYRAMLLMFALAAAIGVGIMAWVGFVGLSREMHDRPTSPRVYGDAHPLVDSPRPQP